MSAQVGDIITTAEEQDSLPRGSIIVDADGEGWQRFTEPDDTAPVAFPAVVLYLPGLPPRPERVVRAEALREWAGVLSRDLAKVERVAPVDASAVQTVIEALRERADRIEATR